MHLLYRIVGLGALVVFLSLVGACAGALQPTHCSADAVAGEWLGEDFWVRADLTRVQRELACGASVNVKNDHDGTPLHWAGLNENVAVTEALLEAGADVNAKDDDGDTPLHFAAEDNENAAVTEALLNAGAAVNAQNDDGKTPLHYAAANNENAAVIGALLEAGADLNARNDDGRTPLEWAQITGNETAIELLQVQR